MGSGVWFSEGLVGLWVVFPDFLEVNALVGAKRGFKGLGRGVTRGV
jgi:hypothetical protein